ncbi:MAG: flagellar assembly protein FliW [Desulfurivibrio sp.]|nr:flagellar assembly protein FliW [Desulfurivibrio sp.]
MAEAAMQLEESSATMIVKSSRFGAMEVDPDRVITMTSTMPGFPESQRFVLRQHSSKSPFMWLQSVDNPQLAFVVIRAALLVPQYQPELPVTALRELGEDDSKLDMLLILSIPKGKPEQMTANLLGPLMINSATRRAKQIMLDPSKYDASWPVFEPEQA